MKRALALISTVMIAACSSTDAQPDVANGSPPDAALVDTATVEGTDAESADVGPDQGTTADAPSVVDPCEDVDCGHGLCVAEQGKATCTCDQGYEAYATTCVRVYAMTCQVASESSVSAPDTLDDAFWWDGGWYLAVDDQLAKISSSGATLIDWITHDSGTEYLHMTRLGATASSLIAAFSGSGGASVQTLELNSNLQVKSGPHSLSTGFSGNLEITQDASAAIWAQGYASGDEGHRVGFLAANGSLATTPLVLNSSMPLAANTAIASGTGQLLAAFEVGSIFVQRFDDSGAPLGSLVELPNSAASDGDLSAAYASGAYLVAYSEMGYFGWLRYAIVDPTSGSSTDFEIEVTYADVGESPADKAMTSNADCMVAAHGGKFGIAWQVKGASDNTWHTFFALVSSDGTLLAKPVHLGPSTVVPWPGRTQIIAAGANGFVVFWPRQGYPDTRMSQLSCN